MHTPRYYYEPGTTLKASVASHKLLLYIFRFSAFPFPGVIPWFSIQPRQDVGMENDVHDYVDNQPVTKLSWDLLYNRIPFKILKRSLTFSFWPMKNLI